MMDMEYEVICDTDHRLYCIKLKDDGSESLKYENFHA